MPRKKTVQPDPTSTFEIEDGWLAEIRDKDSREIGRGLDKKFNADELDMQVLHGLVDMYLSDNPIKQKEATNLLESPRGASKLARKLEEWEYELSDRALREHAKKIRHQWSILKSIKEYVKKNKGQN